MKVLLVTSQVTYIPGNYRQMLETLLEEVSEHIHSIAFLENMEFSLIKTGAGLLLSGAPRIGMQLLTNIAMLPLKQRERLAAKYGKRVVAFGSMNCELAHNYVSENEIDLIINLRTRCIYKKTILELPKHGCLNIHHGILPKYRGTMCDLYALYEGRKAGFSLHKMNEKIDDGNIICVNEVTRGDNYYRYLKESGKNEGREIAKIIKFVAKEGKLPEGSPNRADEIVYTRNPGREKLKELTKVLKL